MILSWVYWKNLLFPRFSMVFLGYFSVKKEKYNSLRICLFFSAPIQFVWNVKLPKKLQSRFRFCLLHPFAFNSLNYSRAGATLWRPMSIHEVSEARRVPWAGHVLRMPDDNPNAIPDGRFSCYPRCISVRSMLLSVMVFLWIYKKILADG